VTGSRVGERDTAVDRGRWRSAVWLQAMREAPVVQAVVSWPAMSEAQQPAFRRAVIALNGGPSDARIVRLVSEQARQTKADLIAVHVLEIDWTRPLDADVAGESDEVQWVLDRAESVAEASKVRLEPVLLQARDVGAAIVDETVEREADLLVVGLPYRKRFGGEFAIGRTIPYILQNAPCAVWVVRDPISEETK
jgi:nucleotide-binding universal stress UspA family protein